MLIAFRLWPQAKKLKSSLHGEKFEVSEELKTHLRKVQLGYSDRSTAQLWSEVERRIEGTDKDENRTAEDEPEKRSTFWWLFKDTTPQL